MDTRAIVIGGGPVGLAVSTVLGRAGWDVTVLEARRDPTPMDESRAITWMPEGLLFADEVGITDRLRAAASVRTRHEFRLHPTGEPTVTVRFDRLEHPHPYTLNLPQHVSESLLGDAAVATGSVVVRRGYAVTEVRDDGAGVAATGTDADGRAFSITGEIGIVADGARSLRHGIGRELGITGASTDYGARTVVADVLVDADPADGSASWVALDPRRPIGAFRFGDRRWRLIYRVNAGESDDGVRQQQMVERTARRAWPGTRVDRILWTSTFKLGQGQAAAYSAGRWVLVGDAAHAMGPSAGAGMMVGLLGAWRLGRQLAEGIELRAALGRYEEQQRELSRSVQRGNAMIFRNLAVTSPAIGIVRSTALRMLGTSETVGRRLAASEALVGAASTMLSE